MKRRPCSASSVQTWTPGSSRSARQSALRGAKTRRKRLRLHSLHSQTHAGLVPPSSNCRHLERMSLMPAYLIAERIITNKQKFDEYRS